MMKHKRLKSAELLHIEPIETINNALNKTEQYNRSLIEASLDPLLTIGTNGIITDVNIATEKITGLPRNKLIGTVFSEYFTEPEKAEIGYLQVLKDGKLLDFELKIKHIDGYVTPVLYNASVYKNDKGEIIGIFAAARDITNILKVEDELNHLKSNLEILVNQKVKELIIADKELAFQTGEKADRAAELVIADKELAFQTGEKADRAAELIIANKDLVFQNEEKDKRAAELIIANKELALQNEEILFLSHHDFLTGVYNRIFFEEEKKRLDTPRQLPISIIMGDINGLKLVNDGFGHSKGDEVLIEIAKILKSCCRKEDIISRIGGDEFGILLSKTDSKSAQLVCSRISDTCKGYALDGSSIYPSISVGHATKNMETETMVGIFMAAEESMSRQKLLESKSAHSSILASIKAIMFEKSQETEEHAERMVQLSKSIGLAMSLTDDQLNELELLSTLHDIGKMGISVDILSKPSKLSDEEWVEMRRHPEVGFRIAQATSELIPIAKYILCHHERWDGKGYPQGLIGEKIPLLSRIVAIADSFDAMTNDRAYRSAMTKGEAIEEIRRNSGTQFDPEVTRVFIEKVLGQEWEQLNRAEA